MLRAGHFRHRLLDDSFLKNQSSLAFECLTEFVNLWRKKEISDVEIATIYILVFSFLRRPQDFLGGPHNETLDTVTAGKNISAKDVLQVLRERLPDNLRMAKSLSRLDSKKPFVEHFCSMSWRSIPLSVAKSLTAWNSGRYPLRLLTYVPTPADVLRMQTQGERCLSMLLAKEQMENLVEAGRDVLGFIVHDLIHADHFFAEPEKARAQIRFSQKIAQVLEMAEIQKMLAQDPSFSGEFDYLMSDMNSVPLHLLKTLKAILLGFYKRREGLGMASALSYDSEQEFLGLFAKVLEPWKLPPEALLVAYRLNTSRYQGREDSELLHLALS
ncbi:hypothetical protein [Bdellovibrio bacteriovorus]|uniref:hypothetical protein n=1 Tax=Bdellovibrio bacteriovorus TaxID=959 RepID=UPI0035A6D9D2